MVKKAESTKKELEVIKKTEGDFEYWSARDLMPILSYQKWSTFFIHYDGFVMNGTTKVISP